MSVRTFSIPGTSLLRLMCLPTGFTTRRIWLITNFEGVYLQRFPIIRCRCRSENKLCDNSSDKAALEIRSAGDTCITEISFALYLATRGVLKNRGKKYRDKFASASRKSVTQRLAVILRYYSRICSVTSKDRYSRRGNLSVNYILFPSRFNPISSIIRSRPRPTSNRNLYKLE